MGIFKIQQTLFLAKLCEFSGGKGRLHAQNGLKRLDNTNFMTFFAIFFFVSEAFGRVVTRGIFNF